LRTALPAIALVAALSGCTDEDPDTTGHPSQAVPTPTSADQCNHRAKLHGDGNGIGLKAHWLEGHHPWGTSAPVFVCSAQGMSATVTVVAPSGITVTPASQGLNPEQPDILQFNVTATQGAVGQVTIGAHVFSSAGDVASPNIVADGDGWTFAETSEG
jgi:hypothetical protein